MHNQPIGNGIWRIEGRHVTLKRQGRDLTVIGLGLHRISASASANPKFGHFSQIRPNFWPNLADANATAVRSVSYLFTDKN